LYKREEEESYPMCLSVFMLDFVQERRRRIIPNVFVWGLGWRWVLLFYEEPLVSFSSAKTKKQNKTKQNQIGIVLVSISHIKLELEISIVIVAELHFTHE
jgi:hypothetical protein